jgi:hypothetical protein
VYFIKISFVRTRLQDFCLSKSRFRVANSLQPCAGKEHTMRSEGYAPDEEDRDRGIEAGGGGSVSFPDAFSDEGGASCSTARHGFLV